MIPTDLCSARELADELRHVSAGTLYRQHRLGRIPAYRLSPRRLVFSRSEVLAAMREAEWLCLHGGEPS